MDPFAHSDVDATAAVLAARASEAARELYERASGQADAVGIEDLAELRDVLGSLKLVVENLTGYLPELSQWLERQLWAGTLGDTTDVSFDELTRSAFEVASALARARRISAQLGRELRAAQLASGDLWAQ
ncbi:hypothetical protein ABZ863_15430 [Saccharomonospora sp. NPDC046836]|uniref:hypothetical protein n=1 Tax=Saccharomonospora sp. NPDC046836 TaxID=3156921 RepID=UPI0033D39A78